MKQMNFFILCLMTATSVLAANANNAGNNNQQGAANNYGAQCKIPLQNSYKERLFKKGMGGNLNKCESHAVAALVLGQTMMTPPQRKSTADGAITCLRDGGYTADFGNCSTMLLNYNAVLLAEKGMITAQGVMVNEANKKASKVVEAEIVKGNGHNAAIDATIARNELNTKLFTRQANLYKTAIASLSANLLQWATLGGKKSLPKKCPEDPKLMANLAKEVETELGIASFGREDCQMALMSISGSSVVFLNGQAMEQFGSALLTFKQKLDQAKQQALNNEMVGEKLKKMLAQDLATDNLDKCMTAAAMNDPECVAAAEKITTNTGTFTGNTIDFGGAGSNQDFSFNEPVDTIGEPDPTVSNNDTESVQDIASPFEKDAKEASGILNPAGAASMTPGAQTAGAGLGGGGAGGGGGGGSASLGDDLTGVAGDEDGDPDIKSGKVSGKYNTAKGAGFSALSKSGGSPDVNPFKSMFDSEGSEGGVEESDVVADVGGVDSELFTRIGRKYKEVQDLRLNKNQPE